LISFGWLILFFISVFIVIVFLAWLWGSINASYRSAFGGVTYLIAFALSGTIVYLIRSIFKYSIRGFDTIGIYIILFLIAVLLVFLYQLYLHITKPKTEPQKDG
jgi:hypothetical protein